MAATSAVSRCSQSASVAAIRSSRLEKCQYPCVRQDMDGGRLQPSQSPAHSAARNARCGPRPPQRPRRRPLRIDRLDHLVLTVADVDRTVEFYSRVLGMEPVSFGSGRRASTFGTSKINLHRVGQEFEPKAAEPTPGSADLCLISVDSLDAVVAHLAECGVSVEEGPVQRTGATGPITSVYFRDPDGNLVEISSY